MTQQQPKSLRERLTEIMDSHERAVIEKRENPRAPQLAAADRYLKQLAATLADDIRDKVSRNDVQSITLLSRSARKFRDSAGKTTKIVTFTDPSLSRVTRAEVLKMEGYAALNEVCARKDVDVCLGRPASYRISIDDSKRIFSKVAIYFELGYDQSEDARQKTNAAAEKDRALRAQAARELPHPRGPGFGTRPR